MNEDAFFMSRDNDNQRRVNSFRSTAWTGQTFTTHTTLNTEQNQLAIKVSADNQYYRNASWVLIVEFLRIQILTDRTSGTRTRVMLTFKFVEICWHP